METPRAEIDAERARAHATAREYIVRPMAGVLDVTIDTLSESPWVHHKIEAGWLCIQAFMRNRGNRPEDSALTTRARTIWLEATGSIHASAQDQLHTNTSLLHIPFWQRVKKRNFRWNNRERQRQLARTQGVYTEALRLLDTYSKEEQPVIIGGMSELIVADVLNRMSITSGARSYTIPAQSWNDRDALSHKTSFDLWQTHEAKDWDRVQVKSHSSQRTPEENNGYDLNTAVIFLDEHIGNNSIPAICRHLAQAPMDDDIAGNIARSIQSDIDNHFAKNPRV